MGTTVFFKESSKFNLRNRKLWFLSPIKLRVLNFILKTSSKAFGTQDR